MFAIMPGRTLPTVDRQAGARLLQTRRLIASAQAASSAWRALLPRTHA